MKHVDVAWLCVAVAAATLAVADCAMCSAAKASSSDCDSIRDHDKWAMCKAVTTGKPSWCEFIRDHDTRQECKARVKK